MLATCLNSAALLYFLPLAPTPPQPLPQDSIMNACYRGCRLYSICQFVNGNAGFNTSREECQGGESWRLWRVCVWHAGEDATDPPLILKGWRGVCVCGVGIRLNVAGILSLCSSSCSKCSLSFFFPLFPLSPYIFCLFHQGELLLSGLLTNNKPPQKSLIQFESSCFLLATCSPAATAGNTSWCC